MSGAEARVLELGVGSARSCSLQVSARDTVLVLPVLATRTALRAPWPCMGFGAPNKSYMYLGTGTAVRQGFEARCHSWVSGTVAYLSCRCQVGLPAEIWSMSGSADV